MARILSADDTMAAILFWLDYTINHRCVMILTRLCPGRNTENHSTSIDCDNESRAHLRHIVTLLAVLVSYFFLIEYTANLVICIYSETSNKHSIVLARFHRRNELLEA